MDTSMVFIIIIAAIFGLGTLFIPTWVAMSRDVWHVRKVVIWNILIGWTGTGWVICLAMALSSKGGEWKNPVIAAVWFGSTALLSLVIFVVSSSP